MRMRLHRQPPAGIERNCPGSPADERCTVRERTSTVRAVTQTVDGRTARSARTRDAVVAAVLELVRAGNPRPTAKEIAARAGISLRSVYVHFDDLDDLFAAAGARQTEAVAHLLYPVDATLGRPERIAEVVRQRSAIWEELAPVRRAVLVWESSSPALPRRVPAQHPAGAQGPGPGLRLRARPPRRAAPHRRARGAAARDERGRLGGPAHRAGALGRGRGAGRDRFDDRSPGGPTMRRAR